MPIPELNQKGKKDRVGGKKQVFKVRQKEVLREATICGMQKGPWEGEEAEYCCG